LVAASGMWPAVWLANVFWPPMRELHAQLAGAVGAVPADYQPTMERVLDLVEARDARAAVAEMLAFFARVDAGLLAALETVLAAASPPPDASPARRTKPRPLGETPS
ncbi:MAG TPA: hypothetical protein VHB21_07585, partial [Minicystis sp.]|nr:hypothetical protein [Minicystis sp.]